MSPGHEAHNGLPSAATLRRGREPVRGNTCTARTLALRQCQGVQVWHGPVGAYITVNDRRTLYDTETRGSQRDSVRTDYGECRFDGISQ